MSPTNQKGRFIAVVVDTQVPLMAPLSVVWVSYQAVRGGGVFPAAKTYLLAIVTVGQTSPATILSI